MPPPVARPPRSVSTSPLVGIDHHAGRRSGDDRLGRGARVDVALARPDDFVAAVKSEDSGGADIHVALRQDRDVAAVHREDALVQRRRSVYLDSDRDLAAGDQHFDVAAVGGLHFTGGQRDRAFVAQAGEEIGDGVLSRRCRCQKRRWRRRCGPGRHRAGPDRRAWRATASCCGTGRALEFRRGRDASVIGAHVHGPPIRRGRCCRSRRMRQ